MFAKFFHRADNKISTIRNVWLLNPRNFGDSDHHDSFSLEDMSDDIVRFMDQHHITMATIGGHGFGAKLATATAINHMNRFTGVICLDGGPLDHKYYPAYQELVANIEHCRNINMSLPAHDIQKKVNEISCACWRRVFNSNLITDRGYPQWKFNIEGLYKNVRKHISDISHWSPSYGLWPGQAQVLFPAMSKWIHLNSNTLQLYNVFPKLDGKFPSVHLNTMNDEYDSNLNHWMHMFPEENVSFLAS